ncbi:MAG: helix-turn-helix domain-containing protein [Syntrophomonadaceae bacterium]|nr:helix-turn-helix domain-containing protein [Syntrophomonadaceae bacterium]
MSNENLGKGSYPPWSRIPSLVEMTADAGIDFDAFIAAIEKNHSLESMAKEFGISVKTVKNLQDHFFHYGISSVIGGD